MPPVTATLESPARIEVSARPSERMPEAQTLLMVSEGTSFGIPPLIWAWREGICPWPACRTWPKTTCSTCSGATPERSSAASMTVPPRSVASRDLRPPPIFPNGVRAVPKITELGTELGIYCLSFLSSLGLAPVRQVQRVTIPTGRSDHPPTRVCGWRVPDRAGVGRREAEWQRHLADRGRRPAKCVRRRQACVGVDGRSLARVPPARGGEQDEDVGDDVERHVEDRQQDHDVLDRRHVAAVYRFDQQQADPGKGED